MLQLNENISLDDLLHLLNTSSMNDEVKALISNTNFVHDEVKGLQSFLIKNDFNIEKLKHFIGNAEQGWDKIASTTMQKKSNFSKLRVAAVLFPLIVISGYFLVNKVTPNERLYTSYYEKEIGLPVFMGMNEALIFQESMNAFKDAAFEEALVGFNALLEATPNNDTLLYFIACSNMELNNLNAAIEKFNLIAPTSSFKEKAAYRTALIYLKLNKKEESKELLIKIKEASSHRYHAKAKELLQEDFFMPE